MKVIYENQNVKEHYFWKFSLFYLFFKNFILDFGGNMFIFIKLENK